ncbi:MAG: helix-turn-helix domain-containing protein [Thermoplasmata archaeon]|nr:MAG: helix-turn-helix domain-containing protein [Thermoplasmata archaeon]
MDEGSVMNDHELMFELSHPGRLETLRILKEKPHRLTDISKVLDLTSAEVSRHLGRLSRAQLVDKDGEGRYRLSPFGDIILQELSKFNFLTTHNEYFSTHDFSVVPEELRWLSPLSSARIVKGTLEIMSIVEDLTRGAKKQVCVMSDQAMRSMVDLTVKRAEEGVSMRFIYQKGADVPKEYKPKKGLPIEVRLVDEVKMSQKYNQKVAGIALPNLQGKVDYGFALMGEDAQFLKWIELLFNYFWQKGKDAF